MSGGLAEVSCTACANYHLQIDDKRERGREVGRRQRKEKGAEEEEEMKRDTKSSIGGRYKGERVFKMDTRVSSLKSRCANNNPAPETSMFGLWSSLGSKGGSQTKEC